MQLQKINNSNLLQTYASGLSLRDSEIIKLSETTPINEQDITEEFQISLGMKIEAGLSLLGINPDRLTPTICQQMAALILTKFSGMSVEQVVNCFTWAMYQETKPHYGQPSAVWLYNLMKDYKHYSQKLTMEAEKFIHNIKFAYYDHIEARKKDSKAIPKMICDSYQDWIDTKGNSDLPLLTRNCFDFAADIGLIGFNDIEKDLILTRATQSVEDAKKRLENESELDGKVVIRLKIMKLDDYKMFHAWGLSFNQWYQSGFYVPELRKKMIGEAQSLSGHCPLPYYRHEELWYVIKRCRNYFPDVKNSFDLVQILRTFTPQSEESEDEENSISG